MASRSSFPLFNLHETDEIDDIDDIDDIVQLPWAFHQHLSNISNITNTNKHLLQPVREPNDKMSFATSSGVSSPEPAISSDDSASSGGASYIGSDTTSSSIDDDTDLIQRALTADEQNFCKHILTAEVLEEEVPDYEGPGRSRWDRLDQKPASREYEDLDKDDIIEAKPGMTKAEARNQKHRDWAKKRLDLTGEASRPTSDKFKWVMASNVKDFLEGHVWRAFREQVNTAISDTSIKNIVCLGPYTLFNAQDWSMHTAAENSWGFIHEVSTVMGIAELVKRRNKERAQGNPFACLEDEEELSITFQDPWFGRADVRLLTSLSTGVRVVKAPYANDDIDEHTLVFGMHLPRDVNCISAFRDEGQAQPAVFIGNNLHSVQRSALSDLLCDRLVMPNKSEKEMRTLYERSQGFIESHYRAAVKPFKSPLLQYNVFGNTTIWWPKPES